MSNPLPPPPLNPFERLRISDGLLINAERWQIAHAYHRQRQNLHFQSLHQPGIVDGLGVSVIPAPETVSSQFRDRRWLQIQPGLAIDVNGNPIVVPEPVEFRIASNLESQGETIYLVLRYVDPDALANNDSNYVVRETYRIDEKDRPPLPDEIELCRIHLEANYPGVENAQDVMAPGVNTLDLRYRPQVCPRTTASIRVAVRRESPLVEGIESLLRSLPGLYPQLQPLPPLIISKFTPDILTELMDCAALFMSQDSFLALSRDTQAALHRYIQSGGNVVVEHPMQGDELGNLLDMHQRLCGAIRQISNMQDMVGPSTGRSPAPTSPDSDMDAIHSELTQELDAIALLIDQKMSAISGDYDSFIDPLGINLISWDDLPPSHPMRCQPFNFSRLPSFAQQIYKILIGRGFSVILGNVSSAWQGYLGEPLSRSDLRAAEELGINALYSMWQRHRLTRLQREVGSMRVDG